MVTSNGTRRVSRLPSQGMNWLNKRIPLWQTESRLLSWAHSFQLTGPESRLSKQLSGRMTSHMGLGQTHYDSKSEEHTSELQTLMRITYTIFCMKINKMEIIQSIYIKS